MTRFVCRVYQRLDREIKRWASYIFSIIGKPYSGLVFNADYSVMALESIRFPETPDKFDVFCFEVERVSVDAGYIWAQDVLGGGRWPYRWHSLLSYKLNSLSDVKTAWELGRGQIFLEEAITFRELDAGIRTTVSFINGNKVGYGVQWLCPMDVSIRLVNLIITQSITYADRGKVEDKIFDLSCSEHYNFIRKNVEEFKGGCRNNHYLSNLMAMAWYSVIYVKELDLCLDIYSKIERELDKQFHSDGSNFEGAVSYHFLSSEIILLAVSILFDYFNLSNLSVDQNPVIEKLTKILMFSKLAVSSSGYPSRVGDDDSGMVVRPYNFSKVAVCERNRVLACNRIAAYEMFLSEVKRGKKNLASSVVKKLLEINVSVDNQSVGESIEFGLYKRCIGGMEFYLRHIEELGSEGLGGHNHMDDGAFELFVEGTPVIVDPGTYCYTARPEKRNAYRTSEAHNCINTMRPLFKTKAGLKGIFSLEEWGDSSSSIERREGQDRILSNRGGGTACRAVSYFDSIHIRDSVDYGDGSVILKFYPELDVVISDMLVTVGGLINIRFLGGAYELNIDDYFYSDFYLNERLGKQLVVRFHEFVEYRIEEVL